MKWWWWERLEQGANPNIERMLNIFYLRFSAREEKAVSRICASKTGRNLHTFGRCSQFKQSCPWASQSYFCTRKTSREINAVGRVVLRKNVSEKLSIINPFWRRRNPCNLNPTNIVVKKPQPLLWNRIERGSGRKRKVCNRWLIMQKYNHRGKGGGHVKRDEKGG